MIVSKPANAPHGYQALPADEQQGSAASPRGLWTRVRQSASNSTLFPQNPKSFMLLGMSALGVFASTVTFRRAQQLLHAPDGGRGYVVGAMLPSGFFTGALLTFYKLENRRAIEARRNAPIAQALSSAPAPAEDRV